MRVGPSGFGPPWCARRVVSRQAHRLQRGPFARSTLSPTVARRARMKMRMAALALPLALGACGDTPVEPGPVPDQVAGARVPVKGTGLVLQSLTDVTVPIIGLPLATLEIDQVQIL